MSCRIPEVPAQDENRRMPLLLQPDMGLEQTIVAYYILVNNDAKVKKIMLTHLNFNDFLTLHSKIYVTLQLVNNLNIKRI